MLNGTGSQEKGLSGKLVIITDPTVNRLFGGALRHNLIQDGFSGLNQIIYKPLIDLKEAIILTLVAAVVA